MHAYFESTNRDPVVYLLTGRKSVRAFKRDPYLLLYSSDENRRPLGDVEGFPNHLIRYRVTRLMVTPMSFYLETTPIFAPVNRFMQRYPGVMKPVFIAKTELTQIWKIDWAMLARSGR